MQDRGERLENDTFASILQSVSFRVILVVPVERLNLHIVKEGFPQIPQTFDGELDICWSAFHATWRMVTKDELTVKVFHDRRFKVHVQALDKVLHLALEQGGNSTFGRRALLISCGS
jgi:hypothetical protein